MIYLLQKHQTKSMIENNYRGLRCHFTYGKLVREHDKPQGYQNTSHHRRQQNTYWGKRGDLHNYHRRDGKIHCVMLSNMAVIPGLHVNLFSVTQTLKKGLQVTSENETLILKKKSTKIRFDKKMKNKSREGFLLTTKLYNSKKMLIFWPPIRGSRNENQPYRHKGQPSTSKNKRQSKQL